MLSKKGHHLLRIDGYTFYKDRIICNERFGTKSTWRCSSHHRKGCRATVHMVEDEIFKINNIHTH